MLIKRKRKYKDILKIPYKKSRYIFTDKDAPNISEGKK
jgi:hypothetical protein